MNYAFWSVELRLDAPARRLGKPNCVTKASPLGERAGKKSILASSSLASRYFEGGIF